MKKIILFIMLAAVILGMTACSLVNKEVEYLTEDGREYLVLPTTKTKVLVRDEIKPYLDKIDFGLLKAADEKIKGELPENARPGYSLNEHEGSLRLSVEAIVDIDPPKYGAGGVVEDHEHLFFSEKITK